MSEQSPTISGRVLDQLRQYGSATVAVALSAIAFSSCSNENVDSSRGQSVGQELSAKPYEHELPYADNIQTHKPSKRHSLTTTNTNSDKVDKQFESDSSRRRDIQSKSRPSQEATAFTDPQITYTNPLSRAGLPNPIIIRVTNVKAESEQGEHSSDITLVPVATKPKEAVPPVSVAAPPESVPPATPPTPPAEVPQQAPPAEPVPPPQPEAVPATDERPASETDLPVEAPADPAVTEPKPEVEAPVETAPVPEPEPVPVPPAPAPDTLPPAPEPEEADPVPVSDEEPPQSGNGQPPDLSVVTPIDRPADVPIEIYGDD